MEEGTSVIYAHFQVFFVLFFSESEDARLDCEELRRRKQEPAVVGLEQQFFKEKRHFIYMQGSNKGPIRVGGGAEALGSVLYYCKLLVWSAHHTQYRSQI